MSEIYLSDRTIAYLLRQSKCMISWLEPSCYTMPVGYALSGHARQSNPDCARICAKESCLYFCFEAVYRAS